MSVAIPTEYLTILPFSLPARQSGLRFFINVQKVARVLEKESPSPLPKDMAPFSSLCEYQNTPVPIIELSAFTDQDFLGIMPSDAKPLNYNLSGATRILIINIMNHLIGIEVLRTRKVQRRPNTDLMPPPGLLRDHPKKLISGFMREGHDYLYMFDIEGFLQSRAINLQVPNSESNVTASLKGARILVVEDSIFFQALAKQLLEKSGAEVDLAINGEDALTRLENVGPRYYNVIFSDIEMPIVNGIEMARRIIAKGYRTPIVFHSSISNQTILDDIRNEGLGTCLVKFDEGHVVRTISECIAKS